MKIENKHGPCYCKRTVDPGKVVRIGLPVAVSGECVVVPGADLLFFVSLPSIVVTGTP